MEALAVGEVAAMLDILVAVSVVERDPARVLEVVAQQLHRVIACDAIVLTAVLAAATHTAYARSPRCRGRPEGARGVAWFALSVVSEADGADRVRIDCMRSEIPFEDRHRVALELLAPRLRGLLIPPTVLSTACSGLSDRERQVLDLAAAGRSNKEIGRALFLAPDTVRKHLEHVYEKLGVHNRTEASALLRGTSRDGGATRT